MDTNGNLVVGEQQVVIIRGGFKDNQLVDYEDEFDPTGERLGSVNLEIKFVENF